MCTKLKQLKCFSLRFRLKLSYSPCLSSIFPNFCHNPYSLCHKDIPY